jgi:hypothetical protein
MKANSSPSANGDFPQPGAVRVNIDKNVPAGQDKYVESYTPLFGWTRPTRGFSAQSRAIEEEERRDEELKKIADLIDGCVEHWTDKTIELATLLKRAQDQFPNSAKGRAAWKGWVAVHTKLGESRLRELLKIAAAEDKVTAVLGVRLQTAQRVAKHRDNKKAAALRNGATVSVREKLADWAMYGEEDAVRETWNQVSRWNPPKSLRIAKLDMHLYVREGRALKSDEISRVIGVNRGVASDLIEYGLRRGIIRSTKTGAIIRAGAPQRPLDLYQFLVKNGLMFHTNDIYGSHRKGSTESQRLTASIKKDGKFARANEMAIEAGYLTEEPVNPNLGGDHYSPSENVERRIEMAFRGEPSFRVCDEENYWIWKAHQNLIEIEQKYGVRAAAIFDCCVFEYDLGTMRSIGFDNVKFDLLWELLHRGRKISDAVKQMGDPKLSRVSWEDGSEELGPAAVTDEFGQLSLFPSDDADSLRDTALGWDEVDGGPSNEESPF